MGRPGPRSMICGVLKNKKRFWYFVFISIWPRDRKAESSGQQLGTQPTRLCGEARGSSCCAWPRPRTYKKSVVANINANELPHSRTHVWPVAPVAYQVILEPGIGQFRDFKSRRVHTRIHSWGLFLVHILTCGKRDSVSLQHSMTID